MKILASESNFYDAELKQGDFAYHSNNKKKRLCFISLHIKLGFCTKEHLEIFSIMWTVPVNAFAKSGLFLRQWLANFTHSGHIGTYKDVIKPDKIKRHSDL